MSDFMAAEALIIDRLRETIPGVAVFPARDLPTVHDSGQVTPAIHVVLDRVDVEDALTDGVAQVLTSRWVVVAVTRSPAGQRTGEGTRADAGPILTAIFRALSGWEPPGGFSPLISVSRGVRPRYAPGGFLYFPLFFSTSLVIQE